MHPSTTAIITATEYTNGIFLQIHMFRFFMDLCVHWNACHQCYHFASLGIFMHQGYRMQRLTKSLHIFLYGQEIILEDFVLKCNQWKYWMSFIACGCRFSRSYTAHSWLSKGWLLGIWAYQTMQWFSWVTTKQSLTIAQFPMPKATFIEPSWLFTCNKLNFKYHVPETF